MHINNRGISIKYFSLFMCFFTCFLSAQSTVRVDASTQRFIGAVSELDRSKFFVIHSAPFASNPIHQSFYEEYNVTPSGRGFYGPGIDAKKQKGQVGVYPKAKVKKGKKIKSVRRFVATDHPRNL